MNLNPVEPESHESNRTGTLSFINKKQVLFLLYLTFLFFFYSSFYIILYSPETACMQELYLFKRDNKDPQVNICIALFYYV